LSPRKRIQANTELPDPLIADAGYCSTANLEACEERQLDAYISTHRQQHGKRPLPSRGGPPKGLNARGQMERKLRSKAGQVIYAVPQNRGRTSFWAEQRGKRPGSVPI
jgi:hypothetical protein